MNVHGLGEETDAVHLRHALIGEQQGDGIVAGLELAQRGQRGAAGIRAHYAVTVGIMAAEIALDSAQHLRIVVHRQHDRLGHRTSDETGSDLVTYSGASLREALTLQFSWYPCPAFSPRRSRIFLRVMPSCARRRQRRFTAEAEHRRIAPCIAGGIIWNLPHYSALIR